MVTRLKKQKYDVSKHSAEGGKETLRRYGKEHFRKMGKQSAAKMLNRDYTETRKGRSIWIEGHIYEQLIEELQMITFTNEVPGLEHMLRKLNLAFMER